MTVLSLHYTTYIGNAITCFRSYIVCIDGVAARGTSKCTFPLFCIM